MADRFFGWHTIHGVDGEHSEPYMTRVWIGRLRLHVFYRGDNIFLSRRGVEFVRLVPKDERFAQN